MTDHESHVQAVFAARLEVEATQRLLGIAREQAENTVGAVYNAVGQVVGVESARNALENVAVVRDRVPELIANCEVAMAELTRYLGGF